MPAATDYLQRLRQRLLLDADAPVFLGPQFVGESGNARKKLTDLVSPRSEDAITWNVFRTLARLPVEVWLPPLLSQFAAPFTGALAPLRIEFWKRVPPPRSRLLWLLDHMDALRVQDLRQEAAARLRIERVAGNLERWKALVRDGPPERGDGIFEGPTELDITITTPNILVAIEGRYASDIETGTLWDPRRDQIARCLDAALELADTDRQPYFLLVTDDYVHEGPQTPPMSYESLMPRYRDNADFRAAQLPHRSNQEVANLESHIQWLTWADLVDLALDHSADLSPSQKELLRRLVDYLKDKKLLHRGG